MPNKYKDRTRTTINRRFSQLKYSAKDRGLLCDISLSHYTFLISTECFYCGKHTLGVEGGGGLDRIDNKKGYIMGNVLPCCGFCNNARGSFWSVEEFKLIRETIARSRREKNDELKFKHEVIG